MAPRRSHGLPLLLAVSTCALLAQVGLWSNEWSFVGITPTSRSSRVARNGLFDSLDAKKIEELMKDPEKMKQMQSMMDEITKDPEKMKALEAYQTQMKESVEKLKQDPEMKEFFADIEKNGLDALKKYENNDEILRKFSMATGGPMGPLGGMSGMGAPPAAQSAPAPSFKPGDEVIINGLAKAPELNGKKAMVVPPTPEEVKKLQGTGRMIVRLMDTGDQFAVKPENLRTTSQEVDEIMSKGSLDDVSLYNPALQTEAAKLRESGKLDDLTNDPELKPVFEDIKKNGMGALEKYWNDEKLMAKISKVMGSR